MRGQELSVNITGKDSLSEKLAQDYQWPKRLISVDQIEDSMNGLIDTLAIQGYFDVMLNRQESSENLQYNYLLAVGKISDTINLNVKDPKIAAQLAALGFRQDEGFRIPVHRLQSLLDKLVVASNKQGYPLAQLRLAQIERDAESVSAKLDFVSGNRRTIDSLIIKGYEDFPSSFLKHYAKLNTGKTFDPENILKASQSLDGLPFVNSTRDAETLFREEDTSVYLYLKKVNANAFDGVLGFNTDTENGKLRFNGYLDLALVNNLNFGESLKIKYRGDGSDQTNLNVDLTAPYLLKSPLTAVAGFNLFRRDTTFSTNRQQLRLQYQLSRKIAIGISGTLENAESINDQLNSATLADYTKSRAGLTFSFQSGDRASVFDPPDYLLAEAFLANRKTSQEKVDQTGLEIGAGKTFALLPKFSILLKNQTFGLFSDGFFVNELYRIGGINSIRGFRENSIDVNFATVLNADLKYAVAPDLLIQGIADAAYFENEVTAQDGILYSLGLGTSLNTSGGIFSILLAKGFYPNATFELTDLITHIQFLLNF